MIPYTQINDEDFQIFYPKIYNWKHFFIKKVYRKLRGNHISRIERDCKGKSLYIQFCKKILGLNRSSKYATNLKNGDIPEEPK